MTAERKVPGTDSGVSSAATSTSRTSVGPHQWRELKPTFRERILGYSPRCEACYAPPDAHPAHGWNKARPLGDRQPPFVRAWLDV